MTTIQPFVEKYLIVNGYMGATSKVIAAENYPSYPSLTTYFYRSISGTPFAGNNPFFDEIINGLRITRGVTEHDTMINFLNKGYRLIDCYDHSMTPYTPALIVDDLITLNADKIIFLDEDNIETIKRISNYLHLHPNNHILSKIIPDLTRAKLVYPFPSYGNKARFKKSIDFALDNGLF